MLNVKSSCTPVYLSHLISNLVSLYAPVYCLKSDLILNLESLHTQSESIVFMTMDLVLKVKYKRYFISLKI